MEVLKRTSVSPILEATVARAVILAATYNVVLFAVIVQGGTIKRVLERVKEKDEAR